MYCNKVEICGVNTSKLKTLTEEEKTVLLKLCKEGDEGARQRLIDGNLRLVLSIIQRFSGRGENPDDLFQVGCIGLIKAIDNFNTELDVKFSTYAVPTDVQCGKKQNKKSRREIRTCFYYFYALKYLLRSPSNAFPCRASSRAIS